MTVAIRVRSYDQLRSAIAARRRQLGLCQRDADEICGIQPGYLGKIEKGIRKLGDLSLPMILAGLDLDLYVAPRSSTAPVIDHTGSAGQVYDLRPKPEGTSP
jgi:hypothetical protein